MDRMVQSTSVAAPHLGSAIYGVMLAMAAQAGTSHKVP
jgi:hypothetical protein